MEFLSKPQVVRCYCETSVAPKMAAMQLRWNADSAERIWHLPEGVRVLSAAPTAFGINLVRLDDDAFKLELLWNNSYFAWHSLTRAQIMTSSLSLILKALGADLWQLLQQPAADSIAA